VRGSPDLLTMKPSPLSSPFVRERRLNHSRSSIRQNGRVIFGRCIQACRKFLLTSFWWFPTS